MKKDTNAARMMDLFCGLKRAHGIYIVTHQDFNKNKMKGKARTIHEPVDIELWEKHLAGEHTLGIVPIREDNSCCFGAIDVDVYDLDIAALEKKVVDFGLPLVVCASKSSGAHLYLFLLEPVAASVVRATLLNWSSLLGYPTSEVFPKQNSLANDQDVGNWINMPYYNTTERNAIIGGRKASIGKFIERAYGLCVLEEQLELQESEEFMADGPPCLEHLCRNGFPEGARNNGLFDLGVYARLKYGDHDWEEKVEDYNRQYMSPGTSKEVQQVIRSLSKKVYYYMCNQPPIADHCNKTLCMMRKYGVGSNEDSSEFPVAIENLQKVMSVPPIYYVDINGVRCQLESEALLNQGKFRKICVENIDFLPPLVKQKLWGDTVNKLLSESEKIEAPPDATPQGQFYILLEEFCRTRASTEENEGLALGKLLEKDERMYFRSQDFFHYLERHGWRMPPNKIWAMLREYGADRKKFTIKGACVQAWHIPAISRQEEDFDVTDIGEDF